MSELPTFSSSETAPEICPSSHPPSRCAGHVRSNCEKRVAGELAPKGLESYFPGVMGVHNWKDRKTLVDVPLFPGHVFTRFRGTLTSRLGVLRTVGAARIIACHEGISDAEIGSAKPLLRANVSPLIHSPLGEGSIARMLPGSLKDLMVHIKHQARRVLSVELLSRSVSTEVDVRYVEVGRAASLPAHQPAGSFGHTQ